MKDRKVLLNELGSIGLSKQDLEIVVSGYKKISLKKGDYLVEKGKVVEGYFFIIKGFLRSFVFDYKGDEVTTNFYSEDSLILEESSFFMQVPTKEYIQATEDCEL